MDLLSQFMEPTFSRNFADISRRAGHVPDQIVRLADKCNSVLPHKHWKLIADLPWAEEPLLLSKWAMAELSNVTCVRRNAAIYFGLHNPCIRGRTSIGIEIGLLATGLIDAGVLAAFSLEDADVFYTPGDFRSNLLDAVYDIAYGMKDGIGNNVEYTIGLGYCFFIIPAMIKLMRPSSLRPLFTDSIGVCAGFHDGDGADIGSIKLAKEIQYNFRPRLRF